MTKKAFIPYLQCFIFCQKCPRKPPFNTQCPVIDRITLWQTSARHVTVQPNRLLLPIFSSYLTRIGKNYFKARSIQYSTSDFYSETEMLNQYILIIAKSNIAISNNIYIQDLILLQTLKKHVSSLNQCFDFELILFSASHVLYLRDHPCITSVK